MPGDGARGRRTKKRYESCDFFGLHEAAYRDFVAGRSHHVFDWHLGARGHRRQTRPSHRGVDPTRADGVARDLARSDFERDSANETVETGLARAIGPLPGRAELAEHAADGNEAPRATEGHQRGIEQIIRAEEIRLHDAPSLGAARPFAEPRRRRAASVGDHDIEPSPRFGGASHQSANVRFVAHVASKVPSLAPRVSDFADRLSESALFAATYDYARPAPRELESDGSADPLSATCDDGDLSPEKRLGHAAASSTLTEALMPTIKGAVNGDTDHDEEERRVSLRWRRVGLGVIMVVAVGFIAVSTVQIISAVFGLGTTPLATGPIDAPERQCAVGISRLARALDAPARVDRVESPASDPRWTGADAVENECRKAAGGLDAWAALLRLQAAESQLAEASQADLQPLRREVAAHLPADLR